MAGSSSSDELFSVHPLRCHVRGGDGRLVLATRVLNEERNSLQLFYGAEWPRMQAYVEKPCTRALARRWVSLSCVIGFRPGRCIAATTTSCDQ